MITYTESKLANQLILWQVAILKFVNMEELPAPLVMT